MKRGKIYDALAKELGLKEYHTAEIKSVEDARAVYAAVVGIRKQVGLNRKDT